MTGFRLWWHIQKGNDTSITKKTRTKCGDWSPRLAVPNYKEPWLQEVVQYARKSRLDNKTQDEIIKQAIQDKGVSKEANLNTDKCDSLGGQTRPEFYPKVFSKFEEQNRGNHKGGLITEDLKTGFMVFSAVIYCPKSAKETYQLYQFLDHLVAAESPRTMIRAVVNTIQSDALVEPENRRRINEFYLAIDKHFRFEYGKILVATATRTQLKDMLVENWPFFDNFRTELVGCLNGINCERVEDLINTLGK